MGSTDDALQDGTRQASAATARITTALTSATDQHRTQGKNLIDRLADVARHPRLHVPQGRRRKASRRDLAGWLISRSVRGEMQSETENNVPLRLRTLEKRIHASQPRP